MEKLSTPPAPECPGPLMAADSPASQPFELPSEIPIIALQDCFLFPGCFLPLFIFEQRYREMLDHALSEQRMFGVGTLTSEEEDSILPWTTVGLIRASVRQEDGTSNVMLYGVQRAVITGWVQTEPFRIARIEPMEIDAGSEQEAELLMQQAMTRLPEPTPECSEAMKKLRSSLEQIRDPEMVCDILSFHFAREPEVQAKLLAETSLENRYRLLLEQLPLV